MKLPALLVADLHLTASPADEYRWDLFPWLLHTLQQERVATLNILGDITDAKDYHPAKLANRLVGEVQKLSQVVPDVRILMGNHDYLKRQEAYFSFLSYLPGVRYIDTAWEDTLDDGPSVYYQPHTKDPVKDLAGDFTHYDYLFMHQTVKGSVASNGQEMPGYGDSRIKALKIYSGDIHVPQIINGVEYVGSPYHVHFGDDFKPRAVLLDKKGRAHDLHFDSPRRVMLKVGSLKQLRALQLDKGDHVKVTFNLEPSDAADWSQIRRAAARVLGDRGVITHELKMSMNKSDRRISSQQATQMALLRPEDIMTRWVEREELGGEALEIGLELLK